MEFDPNSAASSDSGIFGLPYTLEDSNVIIVGIPWEATVSYGSGTGNAPARILEASKYVELYDHNLGAFYERGIYMPQIREELIRLSDEIKQKAQPIIELGGEIEGNAKLLADLNTINSLCSEGNAIILEEARKYASEGKIIGFIGGDHSITSSTTQALSELYGEIGILQIDAHADLRDSFEGFTYSHASVMHNVLQNPKINNLTQVGLRGICEEEYEAMQNDERVHAFFNSDMSDRKFNGECWDAICESIIEKLPENVYLSLDIDGLEPSNAPHTGTPIPGGLTYDEVLYLLKKLAKSKRRIIGFDLVEVVPSPQEPDLDSITAANLLYQMIGWSQESLNDILES